MLDRYDTPLTADELAPLEAVSDQEEVFQKWEIIRSSQNGLHRAALTAMEKLTRAEFCRLAINPHAVDPYFLQTRIESNTASSEEAALYRQVNLWDSIRLSLWIRKGEYLEDRDTYSACARRIIDGIKYMRLSGLDLLFDWSPLDCGYGSSTGIRSKIRHTWLDAKFAYYVIHKGEHVATIGFDVTRSHLLLSQVQMRKSKGNRWLYQFGGHSGFMSTVVDALEGAFACPVALIDGSTATRLVLYNHRKDLTPEHRAEADRVGALYERDVHGYQRTGVIGAYGGRSYSVLRRAKQG